MLPSPGDLRNFRDETFPVSPDESGDKANLRDRLSMQPPTDEENHGTREPPDDLRTVSIVFDAHGSDFTREATFEICKDRPFYDGRSALLYMVKRFEKHGCDGLSWLASWFRQKENDEHERISIEMRCLITCLHLSGTYGQLNSLCLASMETVAWRITQIVEAYSGEGGKPRLAGVHYYKGRTSAEDCIDPNLRAAGAEKTREELDLENLRGRCADGENRNILPPMEEAAKNGGLEAWRQRRNYCEPGQWRRDDRWPNQIPSFRYSWFMSSERRQVRVWLRDKRREEDVNALISCLNWCSAADSVPRELVDRSLPTFAIPGQRVAFLKLLRGSGVYDTRDGWTQPDKFRIGSRLPETCSFSGQPVVLSSPPPARTVGSQDTHQCRVNCKPSSPKKGATLSATTSSLLASSTWGAARSRSLTGTFVVTLHPASRHIRAAVSQRPSLSLPKSRRAHKLHGDGHESQVERHTGSCAR